VRRLIPGEDADDPWLRLAAAYAVHGGKEKAWPYFGKALQRAADRVGKAGIIAAAAPLPGLLEKLAESAANDAQLQAELARHYAEQGNKRMAEAARTKARVLFEAKLAKEPENSELAAELADLLLIDTTRWTILRPAEMKSEGAATLTLQPDGSILASGINPQRDVYFLLATTDLKQINAIRLEALPDPSLPGNGPGRALIGINAGNFHLNKLRLFSAGQLCPLTNIFVERPNMVGNTPSPFRTVISGEPDNTPGWGNFPMAGKANTAVFATGVTCAPGDDLKIEMYFSRSNWIQHNLGRFRLSVSADPAAFAREQKRFLALKLTSPHAKLGAAYLALDDARRAADFLTKAVAANPNSPAADWLVLALAHARLKETAQAKSACGKATGLLTPAGADAALQPLLRKVLIALGPNSPEATALLAAAAGQPPGALNSVIDRNPNASAGYSNRATWFIDRGLWKEARADLAEAYRLEPTTYNGMRLAILLVHTGEIDRYRAHGKAMLARWASTQKNDEADQTLKTILLVPDFKADLKQLAHLADVAVSGNKNAAWFEWFMLARGLYDYRTGKYADALTTCRESRRRANQGDRQALATMDLAIEAMALFRSGDQAGARRTLAEAKSQALAFVPGIDSSSWSHDWLVAHMLYREAERLIAGKKGGQPK
jgi:tetratricopeptide (TPR) repeat protein